MNIGYEKELKYHTKIVNNFVNNIIAQRIDALYAKTPASARNGNNNTSKFKFTPLKEDESKHTYGKTKTVLTPKMIPDNSIIEKKLFAKYDLLSLFLKDNSKMTHKQLRDTAMAFIIAGRYCISLFCFVLFFFLCCSFASWNVSRLFVFISRLLSFCFVLFCFVCCEYWLEILLLNCCHGSHIVSLCQRINGLLIEY